MWLLVALLAVALAPMGFSQNGEVPKPPATRTDNVKDVLHGVELVDPYRWLEDQQAPETRAWIDQQNAYSRSLIDKLPARDALAKRIGELLKVDFIGTPRVRGNRYFFSKRAANQDLSVIYMREGRTGKDQVLIDPHTLSADRSLSVGLGSISDDGKLLVYSIRKGGEDEVRIKLFDVDKRKDLADEMPRGRYNVSLKPDGSGFYYTRFLKEGFRVFYHAMGTPMEQDKKIFGDGYGPEKIIGAGLSEDGRYLLIFVIHGSAADQSEIYLQDTVKQGPLVTVTKDLKARSFAAAYGSRLYIQTNWNAPRGRVMVADAAKPGPENWKELIPESDVPIEDVSFVGSKIIVTYLRNAVSQVRIFDANGKHLRDLQTTGLGSVFGVSGRWNSNEMFYTFSSFHVPSTIHRVNLASNQSEVWARQAVPIDSEQFEVKQVWYASKDGTKVPMFIVHKKGLKLDGSAPTLLTGYGGFNASETPGFSARAALWIERGGVYALPNLRGGGEFGEEWHKAGMLEKKQNVFDDFIAAAEWLVANKYTRPERLAIRGGSNGGLLVGAAMTQRPDLFGAVVCGYPLLDMVRFHKFLVARWWVPEYGSADNPEQFKYIRAYSPYHNVKKGEKYPATLFVTGDSDTRVDPLHARKMAALVQAANGSNKPIILLYDTKAGHSAGGKPVALQVADLADELSFVFWQLNAL
jgi:prolyl oligopeptidase